MRLCRYSVVTAHSHRKPPAIDHRAYAVPKWFTGKTLSSCDDPDCAHFGKQYARMPRAMCVGKSLCYSGTASIRHLDERLFGRAGIGSHSMSDRLCRMQMMIALPYGVVGVFYFSFGLCQDFKLSKDSLQFACLMGTLFASLTVLSVWRRYVHWSGLRVSSTVALSLLMIGQVVVWKPIWSTTQCAVEEYQKFGQSGSCLGLWMGSCALVW